MRVPDVYKSPFAKPISILMAGGLVACSNGSKSAESSLPQETLPSPKAAQTGTAYPDWIKPGTACDGALPPIEPTSIARKFIFRFPKECSGGDMAIFSTEDPTNIAALGVLYPGRPFVVTCIDLSDHPENIRVETAEVGGVSGTVFLSAPAAKQLASVNSFGLPQCNPS